MLNSIRLSEIEQIAKHAGDIVMDIYQRDFRVGTKSDNSPITEADRKANRYILDNLSKLYPDIPTISEERDIAPYSKRRDWDYFWLIDPLDGTKEFINRNDEFTINIALIEKDTPVLGVVYAPALEKLYSAKRGEGAYLNGARLSRKSNQGNLSVIASRSHQATGTDEFIQTLRGKYPDLNLVHQGSSLKLCAIAEGTADIYPRLAPTSEWDIAAGHAILLEVGKDIYKYDEGVAPLQYLSKQHRLERMKYNKENLNNYYFVAV